ncbi:hypothetical protein DsansV1_C09g0095841 [Dioscorea sansibarensis]
MEGGGRSTDDALDFIPSFLPVNTGYLGAPTRAAASLVASCKISAHETIPGHFFSRILFILSMTAKPRNPEFCGAVFSDSFPSRRIEASQPYITSQNLYIQIHIYSNRYYYKKEEITVTKQSE